MPTRLQDDAPTDPYGAVEADERRLGAAGSLGAPSCSWVAKTSSRRCCDRVRPSRPGAGAGRDGNNAPVLELDVAPVKREDLRSARAGRSWDVVVHGTSTLKDQPRQLPAATTPVESLPASGIRLWAP